MGLREGGKEDGRERNLLPPGDLQLEYDGQRKEEYQEIRCDVQDVVGPIDFLAVAVRGPP